MTAQPDPEAGAAALGALVAAAVDIYPGFLHQLSNLQSGALPIKKLKDLRSLTTSLAPLLFGGARTITSNPIDGLSGTPLGDQIQRLAAEVGASYCMVSLIEKAEDIATIPFVQAEEFQALMTPEMRAFLDQYRERN